MNGTDFLNQYFDYFKLFDNLKISLLKSYKTEDEFLEVITSYEWDVKCAKRLYKYLTSEDYKEWRCNLELDEENTLNFEDEIVLISFCNKDGSYANEDHSHSGGYSFHFEICTEPQMLVGLEIQNHN